MVVLSFLHRLKFSISLLNCSLLFSFLVIFFFFFGGLREDFISAHELFPDILRGQTSGWFKQESPQLSPLIYRIYIQNVHQIVSINMKSISLLNLLLPCLELRGFWLELMLVKVSILKEISETISQGQARILTNRADLKINNAVLD